jgi:hypothetical protein
MPDERNPQDARDLWQDQEVEKVTITLEDVRRMTGGFERRVHWRNVREFVAGAAVVPFLAFQVWHAQGWQRVPGLLLIAGTIFILAELYRRGRAGAVPADAGLSASLAYHRRELERQRDALRSVWLWYLLPMVPGLAAVLVAAGMARGWNARLIPFGVLFAAVLIGVWRLNEWGARKLDRKIEEIRAMESNHE